MPIVSTQEVYLWRHQAQLAAIAASVSPNEVDWLLQEVGGIDKLALRLLSKTLATEVFLSKNLDELSKIWQERLQDKKPVQYLAGVTHWRHFSLKVSPDVLIPRPETEIIIDLVGAAIKLSSVSDLSLGHWVDLGTGSGAIAIGLAEIMNLAQIHAVDCSEAALKIAAENVINLGFTERIKFYQGSWWSPLQTLKGQISGMVSNPPYIPTGLIPQLEAEVVNHEPHLALDGGNDGLVYIRHLVETSVDYLRPGGIWLIEMMAGQAENVIKMLEDQGSYEKIQIFPDLAGIERFALAYHR